MNAENQAKNIEIAKAICAAMGGEFLMPHETSESYFYCKLPDGITFSIRLCGWALKGRIIIGTAYPKYTTDERGNTRNCIQRDFDRELKYSAAPWDGITVSDQKAPEAIAKDITRRFMPTYAGFWPLAVKYCEETNAYWVSRGNAKGRIDAALQNSSGYYIRNYNENTASIEIYSVTPEMAEKLAELLPKRF